MDVPSGGRAQALEPSPAALPGMLAGGWTSNGAADLELVPRWVAGITDSGSFHLLNTE